VPMLGSSCADPEAVKVSGGLDMDRYWLIRHGRKSTGKSSEGKGAGVVGQSRGFHQRGLAKKV